MNDKTKRTRTSMAGAASASRGYTLEQLHAAITQKDEGLIQQILRNENTHFDINGLHNGQTALHLVAGLIRAGETTQDTNNNLTQTVRIFHLLDAYARNNHSFLNSNIRNSENVSARQLAEDNFGRLPLRLVGNLAIRRNNNVSDIFNIASKSPEEQARISADRQQGAGITQWSQAQARGNSLEARKSSIQKSLSERTKEYNHRVEFKGEDDRFFGVGFSAGQKKVAADAMQRVLDAKDAASARRAFNEIKGKTLEACKDGRLGGVFQQLKTYVNQMPASVQTSQASQHHDNHQSTRRSGPGRRS